MTTPRENRIKDFEQFSENSNTIFEKFKKEEKNTFFEDYYMLCVVPGGRNGGIDKNLFEVFYGARAIGRKTEYKDDKRIVKTILERGVTLRYQLFDNGYYSITFFPASTENQRPIEDFIYYRFSKNTSNLLNEKTLKKHWKYFIAYMHLTSLDGSPNLFQRLRIFKLRYFHHLVINEKIQTKKFLKQLKTILNYVLTVGLSGGLLFLITLWSNDQSGEINQLKDEVNELKTEYLLSEKVDYKVFDITTTELEQEINSLKRKSDSLSLDLCETSIKTEQIKELKNRFKSIRNSDRFGLYNP